MPQRESSDDVASELVEQQRQLQHVHTIQLRLLEDQQRNQVRLLNTAHNRLRTAQQSQLNSASAAHMLQQRIQEITKHMTTQPQLPPPPPPTTPSLSVSNEYEEFCTDQARQQRTPDALIVESDGADEYIGGEDDDADNAEDSAYGSRSETASPLPFSSYFAEDSAAVADMDRLLIPNSQPNLAQAESAPFFDMRDARFQSPQR